MGSEGERGARCSAEKAADIGSFGCEVGVDVVCPLSVLYKGGYSQGSSYPCGSAGWRPVGLPRKLAKRGKGCLETLAKKGCQAFGSTSLISRPCSRRSSGRETLRERHYADLAAELL